MYEQENVSSCGAPAHVSEEICECHLSLHIVFRLPLHLMRASWLGRNNEQLGVCAPNISL